MKKVFLILFFIFPFSLQAQLLDTGEEFLTDDWSEGLHIFAGVGFNSSHYHSNTRRDYLGIGNNFKTDVGWYFSHDWAIESSASVKFNHLNGDLIWDTLLTLGLRYRIEDYYYRAFAGAGVLVVVIGENEPSARQDTTRLHMDGPAVGMGFGKIHRTENGKVWFIELNGTAQWIKHRDSVIVDGETPIAISSESVNDNSTIYSLQATVGIMLF